MIRASSKSLFLLIIFGFKIKVEEDSVWLHWVGRPLSGHKYVEFIPEQPATRCLKVYPRKGGG